MKNLELQNLLKQYPDDMDIKLLIDHSRNGAIVDMEEENIIHTSETAYVDHNATEDECDCEDGKVMLGDGKQHLLINPIIF